MAKLQKEWQEHASSLFDMSQLDGIKGVKVIIPNKEQAA